MANIILGSAPTSNNISDAFPNSFSSTAPGVSHEYLINANLAESVVISDAGSPTVNIPAGTVTQFQAINAGGDVQIRLTFDNGARIDLLTKSGNVENFLVELADGMALSLVELTEAFGLEFPEAGDPAVSTMDPLVIQADGTVVDPDQGPEFTLTSDSASVLEGGSQTFTVTASEPVDVDTTVVFTLLPGDGLAPNQGTNDSNVNDFPAGEFNPVTVVILAGETTTAPFTVSPLLDGVNELPEGFTVQAEVAGETLTLDSSIVDGIVQQSIILTVEADEVTPTSTNPDTRTTAEDDLIFAGSVEGGGAHTLGAADIIDGGDGFDTISIREDRNAMNGSTLFPDMVNVERLEIQALTRADVDLTNTSGVEQLVVDRSIARTDVSNLGDDVDFIFNNTAARLTVNYSAIAPVNPTELNVQLNEANGARLSFFDDATGNNQADSATTLNLDINSVAGTTILANTFDGVNQANALDTLNLSGESNVVFSRLTNGTFENGADPEGLTEDLTNVSSVELDGTLNINLLGNNNAITFDGGDGDTRLVIGQGNNTVNFGGGDDLLVLSSTGLNGDDSINGGLGNDTLEVHYNNTNTAQALAGTYAALDNSTGIENLVIDVWSEATENVNLDESLLVDSVTNVFIQDTSDDALDAVMQNSGNGTRDGDLAGTIVLSNVSSAVDYTLLADFVAVVEASGEELNLTLQGLDVDGGPDFDNLNVLDVTGVTGDTNVTLLNEAGSFDDRSTETSYLGTNVINTTAGGSWLNDVQLADGGVLNVDGSVVTAGIVTSEGDDITVDASALNTAADRILTGPNVIDVSAGGDRATIIGTEQDDDIVGTNDDDTIITGEGDNNVFTGDGDDVVRGGSGIDNVVVGEGIVDVELGAGNDTVVFENTIGENLTSADRVDGGEGRDTLAITQGAIVLDGVFNQITNVEILDLANFSTVTFNQIANDRDFDTINVGSGFNQINIEEGFVRNDLTINLDDGNDFVNADESEAAITVVANAGNIDTNDLLIGGSTNDDVLVLVADNNTADLSNVFEFETVRLVDPVIAGPDIGVVVGASTISSGETLVIDGSTLSELANATVDASQVGMNESVDVTTGAGNDVIFGGAGADTIDAGAGDDLIFASGSADTLTGGTGADDFYYTDLAQSSGVTVDVITDFASAIDQILIAGGLLSGLPLNFAGNQAGFGQAQGATTQGDGLIDYVFQIDTNTLWVDLNNDGTLNADDLQIVLAGVSGIAAGDVVTDGAPIFFGDETGAVLEDDLVNIATGDADHVDGDNNDDTYNVVAPGGLTDNQYGTYQVAADGVWVYTLDNANPAVDALNVGDTLTDTFDLITEDGSAQTITITINGANDAPVLMGVVAGTVTEDAVMDTASGDADHTDVDNTDDTYNVVAPGGLTANGYGTYEVAANGVWVYTLDNANLAVDALNVGDQLTDTFDLVTEDGTLQTVTITIDGANDLPVFAGDIGSIVNEDGLDPTVSGDADHTDVDNNDDTYAVVAPGGVTANGYGTYSVAANGVWAYTLDNANVDVDALNVGDSLSDTFDLVTEDGTTQTITIAINGANDAPVLAGVVAGSVTEDAVMNTVSGDADHTDVDNNDDTYDVVAPGGLTANGYGTYEVNAVGQWVYTLDNANVDVDALNVGESLSDTFDLVTEDGTTQTITIAINGANDAPVLAGVVAGSVTEDAVMNTVSGDADHTDVDNTDDTYMSVLGFASDEGYGTYSVLGDGNWTYTLDNGNAMVDALNVGDTLIDTFDLMTEDGTLQTVTITIDGADDALTLNNVDVTAMGISFEAEDVDNDPLELSNETNEGPLAVVNGGITTITPEAGGVPVQNNLEVNNGAGDAIAFGLLVEGTNGGDTVSAVNGVDMYAYGFDGNDTITTGDGDDFLIGGAGGDILDGGAGADTFVLTAGDSFATVGEFDQILNFVQGEDLIDIGTFGTIDSLNNPAFSDAVLIDIFSTATGVEGDPTGGLSVRIYDNGVDSWFYFDANNNGIFEAESGPDLFVKITGVVIEETDFAVA